MRIMGNSYGASSNPREIYRSIQALLRQRDLKISSSTVANIVKDIVDVSPWFAASGDLTLPSWNKLGRDLEQTEGNIGRGTLPFWRMVRDCLKEERNIEILKQGRKALQKHQDSFSESDQKEEQECRPRKKKEKLKDKDPEIKKGEKGKRSPIALVVKEFVDLDLSEEEEQLEGTAAKSEKEQQGSRRRGDVDVFTTKGRRDEAPVPSALPPSAPPPMYQQVATEGHSFIGRQTWSQLAAAFPVFEEPQNYNRWYEPIPYRQLKDLVEAARNYGANASYTITLLRRIVTTALTPTDWQEIARAALPAGQFLDFKSIVQDKAQTQERINIQGGHPEWTADMLLGQGAFAGNQNHYPWEVYRQVSEIHYRAWKSLPNKGETAGNLTKIIQGAAEPFSDYVARMTEAAERMFGNLDISLPFVQQIIFEQSTKECQRAIGPVKGKGLEAWIKACREVGGPLTNAGLAAAVLAAARGVRGDKGKACFKCGQLGHFKKQCPNSHNASDSSGLSAATSQRQPDICPRCKKGKHWANECRSVRDINGQLIPMPIQSLSKNGLRGPCTQGPKIFGAIQNTMAVPEMTPSSQQEGQPKAPEGWTSVPPPNCY